MTQTPPKQRPSKITVPKHAHPFAKLMFAEMKRQAVTYLELELRSGVLISTFKSYRTDNVPSMQTIEAALGSLGWTLVPVPKLETLPDDVRAKLDDIGQHFRSDEETFGAALLAAATWPAYARERPGHRYAPNSLPAQGAACTTKAAECAAA